MQIIFSCWATHQAYWLPGLVLKYFYTPCVQRLAESRTKPEVYLAVCVCFNVRVLKSRVKNPSSRHSGSQALDKVVVAVWYFGEPSAGSWPSTANLPRLCKRILFIEPTQMCHH